MRPADGFSRLRCAIRCLLSAVFTLALALPAAAFEVGMETQPAVMVSAAAPNRQALVIAASTGGGIATDVEAYVATLRLLGFEVTTIVTDSRPGLDRNLRHFSTNVRPDAEVVVLVLGTVLARGQELYVMPAPPTAELVRQPELYGTEGILLSEALRRIVQHGPKDVVTLVDACRAQDGAADCKQGPASLPENVSAIIAYHARTDGAGGPVARIGSLRSDGVALMRREGVSFFAFYEGLQKSLRNTDMALAATPSLSRSFVFLPTDFLARLPTPCNEVSAWTSEDVLRARPLDRIVAACEWAARTYDFSPHFKDNLEIVREQSAFHDAVAGCSDPRPTDAYLRTYPTGPHRPIVERHKEKCRPPPPPPREEVKREPPTNQPIYTAPTPRLVPRGNQPASFPCQGLLSEPVAQLICADRDLAAADWLLGITYRAAMMKRGSAARRMLIAEERDWMQRRNQICGIPTSGQWDASELARFKDCLLREIDRRAHEIESNL